MKTILDLIDLMENEIDTAKDYAERSILSKVENNNEWKDRFEKMSKECLSHASVLNDYLVYSKLKISNVYELPVDIQDLISNTTKRYVEESAIIKHMLAM